MSDLLQDLAGLSPEKRKLLELLLKEQGIELARSLIVPRQRASGAAPLSFAQERLWFLDQLEPGSSIYNIPSAVRLTGPLDVAALERALNEIIRRHESLRTTFANENGQPVQVILPHLTLALPMVDLRDLPAPERETEARRLADEQARQPFDLTRGPLVRVRLLRLGIDDHIVLLTMHHIISDGWSMGVFIREIALLYPGLAAGAPASLPELPVQYADFAAWQRDWLQGDVLQEQLAYWKQQLAGSPPKLELATDHPRPAAQTYRGASLAFDVSREVYDALKALSQREEATLFMTLLAAFQTLLYRYTGQEDLCVGTPIANRNRAEIENLIGFFVNTLVLRADLSGEPTFRELLKRVREVAVSAYAHQDLPFEILVDELHPPRDPSYSPLFQAMFALQSVSGATHRLPDVTLTPLQTHSGTAKFDLTLALAEDSNSLSGVLEYNTDLFDAETIERMLGHFWALLEGIAANPDQRISTLPLLTQAERHQILVEWNDTTADYPRDVCIHDLFQAQVERTPDAPAVVYEGESLTYRELDRRANQLAHFLHRHGVGPDVPVGICCERSLEIIVGIMGVLKAGGAYVPLDPSYPAERLVFILDDTQAPVLLTQAQLASVSFIAENPARKVVRLDADWETIAPGNDAAPANLASPSNLAYVIYTSGSTGKPKGVCCQHSGVINNLSEFQHRQPIAPGDACSWWTSPNFDVSVYEIFAPLLAGGTLYIAPASVRVEGKKFIEWMSAHQIRSAYVPPFMVGDLEAWLRQESATLALHRLLVGVEPIKEQLLASISARAPALRVLNGYGPTEATICCTLYAVSPGDALDRNTPIGKPMWNTQIYLLDSHLQPVPIGVLGEVYIGGAGLARGYFHRPDLTAERFIANPFANAPSARLYKTGDCARFLPDGNIEFIGRTDFQVKVRGYRIELGEIEEVLRQHPNVAQALVLAREDSPGNKRLVGYVVPASAARSQNDCIADLCAYLRTRLPEYMLPSAFVLLDQFPITPNGKVDRRALPAPSASDSMDEFVAPCTPTEEILAGIWAHVLGVSRVGVHDNFFELGGHSLLATQLVSRVRDVFQVELPLRALFESPTVARFSESVEAARRAAQGLTLPPIRPALRDGELPLSFAQQRLWFLDQLEPNSALYNIPSAVRLIGTLDAAALERAMNEIVRRHESLRTTFATKEGRAVQVIAPETTLALPVSDLSDLSETERQAAARRLATEEALRPFDLARGPLLRAHLLRLGEQDHVVLWTMHHIVSDGWSMGVLIREAAELYATFAAGKTPSLPELPIQYADFAAWQREWLRGDALEQQLAYWKQQLSGSPPLLELPTDRPRPAVQTSAGAHQSFTLPKDWSQTFKMLCQREGVTLFMALLAAFQTWLSRYARQKDICVGTPIANRQRAEVENLIGFFVNTLVVRADLSGDPSFRELLQRVRETTLDAYAHQDVPFEMLVDALQPKRDMSHTPLFQVMFVLQNAQGDLPQMPDLTMSPLEIESGLSMFDLTLTMTDSADGLSGAFEYNTDLFDAATITRMIEHFRTLLQGIAADPDQRVSTLPLLTETEQRQLLVEWNDTKADYPRASCVHQLFETQAARTPNAVAVVLPATDARGAERQTYRELNGRANQLAHYLQKLGVQPETRVGICVERSIDMVVGLLGILKSGGAYVPLDPAYPRERLAFILDDSQASVLVTQSHLIGSLRFSALQKVCLDTDGEMISRENDANPTSEATSENLAYVIYTSGSTGQPKGVMVQHRSVVNHNVAAASAFHLQPSDRVLQFATINFDAAVEEMFPAWMTGATVVLRPAGTIPSGSELMRLVEAEQITVLDLPTAYWHACVYGLSLSQTQIPPCLRLLVLGGEKALAERMELWQKLSGEKIAWLNTYGPTEGTIIATLYDPTRDARPLDGHELPIGRPIANTQIYLLDELLHPVPIGVPGELYIGGAGVARGYLNRPDLTAERFVRNPFSGDADARLYKTGDLARYLPDGNIEFIGRTDDQVKIRGFRVETGEIEAALAQHPQVQQAVVVARDEAAVKRLVAYVLPNADGRPQVADLRAFLQAKLPDYMLPSTLVVVDALPLLPNGKIDRRALPAPDAERLESNAEYAAPRTPQEKTLAELWAQVLGVKHVGIHDNFFELGGDSILSIQVIARANQAGLRLTPKQLFQSPTIAGLAMIAGTAAPVNAEQGLAQGESALTPIQRWFFEQEFPEPHHWNQSILLAVSEPLNRAWLEQSIERLLQHHDALRLRFTRDETGWRATYTGMDSGVPLEWIDLTAMRAADQPRAIEEHAAHMQAGLNLAEGPVFRAGYFDLGAGRSGRLLLIGHHLVVDGVSWRILLEDLLTAYVQLSRGASAQLPPKTTSFQYWARRLNQDAQSDALRAEMKYWQAMSALRAPRLPLDHPSGTNSEASARSVNVVLNDAETRALLHDVPAAYHTEINDVLLTALALAFRAWVGPRPILVDLEGHGREDLFEEVDLSRTVGWFTAAYPVGLDLPAGEQIGDALQTIKEQLRRVPQHGIGYGVLRYLSGDAGIGEQLGAAPRAEVTFNYLGQIDQTLSEFSAFSVAPESHGMDRSPRGQRTHLLDITGSVTGGQLQFDWTYSENVHRRATIERVADEFVGALRSLIAHCQSPHAGGYTPSDFPLAQLDQRKLTKVLAKIKSKERVS